MIDYRRTHKRRLGVQSRFLGQGAYRGVRSLELLGRVLDQLGARSSTDMEREKGGDWPMPSTRRELCSNGPVVSQEDALPILSLASINLLEILSLHTSTTIDAGIDFTSPASIFQPNAIVSTTRRNAFFQQLQQPGRKD